MSFNVIAASKKISEQYNRYLKTIFDISDAEYKKLFEEQFETAEPFSKGPYLDVIDSFVKGRSIPEMIESGILSKDFRRLEDIYKKTLYLHQEYAIKKILDGKNVVVSTGTGSGKTECFLIPILDHLMREREKEGGKISPGVRALLIYPMNALANDQIERLRRTLADYPEITFGSYTGQTEYTREKALEIYKKLNRNQETGEDAVPLKNELLSREEMKKSPPHILITNYAMLEYLMLRPEDNVFFQGPFSHNWKFVVMDEAHTYTGSTGIEVSMLLRRVVSKLENPKIQFVLTSATLGDKDSDKKVVSFAEKLCSASFEVEDVVRAFRVDLEALSDEKYDFGTEFYDTIHNLLEEGYDDRYILERICSIFSLNTNNYELSDFLYDTLLRDATFWRIKRFLSIPQSVVSLCKETGWREEQVTAFVDVASRAMRDKTKIFDARYHFFIRATEGVFITLPPYKSVSLTRKNTAWNEGKEYKVFEVVTCAQCHSLYILGSIEENYLVQKSNYNLQDIKEAFYIGDTVHDSDGDDTLEDEKLMAETYELCPYCGFIRAANMVHKRACEHDPAKYIKVIKVKTNTISGRVTKCINCESINRLGILRSFFTGQEASTSVIGTALYEQLPSSEKIIVSRAEESFDDGFNDGFMDSVAETIEESKAKQFIAFSDSRQAAAYFASYFSETYEGILYSRLIRKKVGEIGVAGQPAPRFVAELAAVLKNKELSPSVDEIPDYEAEAWKAVLKELADNRSRNSLAGLGLLAVGVTEDIQFKGNTKYNLSADEVKDVCLNFIMGMCTDAAVYHEKELSEKDILFFSYSGAETTYLSHGSNTSRCVRAFVPKTETRTNKRMEYLERVLVKKGNRCDREEIAKLLEAFWDRFFLRGGLVKNVSARFKETGYQVDTAKLIFSAGEKWYRCPKCHRITAYNVGGVCPSYMCDGELQSVDVHEIGKENHYYRLYNELTPCPLRVVEHTAQLNRDEAYHYQSLFKQKKIDVLSCSTTFEMGVDVGMLETVFMRNMPPSPSNYAQRAGRAGRSTNAAAFALTFCTKSNHDFNFFKNPVNMIRGIIVPPSFKTENEKICIRHVYASALSLFWKKYPQYFENAQNMLENDSQGRSGYTVFREYLNEKPEELKAYLKVCLPEVLVKQFEIETFGWVKWMFDEERLGYPNFERVYQMYTAELKTLQEEKKKVEEKGSPSDYILKQIHNYQSERIINFLSKNGILPKYGFPVDTVELKTTNSKLGRLGLDLSRDLSVAISEYAPGCQVVANGKLITSRYIRKVPNKHWKMYDYVQCNSCQTLNMEIHTESSPGFEKCKQCGADLRKSAKSTFLIPDFGFIAESKISTPTLVKPERTYRTEAAFVNYDHQLPEETYDVNDLKVCIASIDNGPMAILTTDTFFVCQSCGYAQEATQSRLPFVNSIKQQHIAPSGRRCSCDSLEKFALGYRFETDVVRIKINKACNAEEAYSVLQAILLSACAQLNIDNREIAGCLQYCSAGIFYYILYDTTPGGAGHVKRLNSHAMLTAILQGAYRRAKFCDCGGEEGDSSCYSCLRTYENQRHHDMIKRKYVVEYLEGVNDMEK